MFSYGFDELVIIPVWECYHRILEIYDSFIPNLSNLLSLTAVPTHASPIATDPVGLHVYNRESVAFLFTARKTNLGIWGCCEFIVRPDPLPLLPLGMCGRKYESFAFDRPKPCLGCLKSW